MDVYAKKLSIQLQIEQLSAAQIDEIRDILITHKGNSRLQFTIFDNDEKIQLSMNSRKQKIKISQELLHALEDHKIIYKLN